MLLTVFLLVFLSFTGVSSRLQRFYIICWLLLLRKHWNSLGNVQTASTKARSYSTLLLFSLFDRFFFSVAENVLAFVLEGMFWEGLALGMLWWRGLVASLIHIVATGIIALIMMKNSHLLLWDGDVCGIIRFFLHFAYNLALVYGQWWPSDYCLLSIYHLSYLLVSLDELYEN